MMRYFRIIFPVIVIINLVSCGKIEQLPAEPRIEFRKFTVFDSTDILGNQIKGARLTFYFEDGDGDLGLDEPLTGEDDTINLFLSLYRKQNGYMTPAVPGDPLYPTGYRIPYMERKGQNKILKGTTTVTLLYSHYNRFDTIMYYIYIVDRAGNESNTVSTCEIVLSENGDCDVSPQD